MMDQPGRMRLGYDQTQTDQDVTNTQVGSAHGLACRENAGELRGHLGAGSL